MVQLGEVRRVSNARRRVGVRARAGAGFMAIVLSVAGVGTPTLALAQDAAPAASAHAAAPAAAPAAAASPAAAPGPTTAPGPAPAPAAASAPAAAPVPTPASESSPPADVVPSDLISLQTAEATGMLLKAEYPIESE